MSRKPDKRYWKRWAAGLAADLLANAMVDYCFDQTEQSKRDGMDEIIEELRRKSEGRYCHQRNQP